jgi:hypothetical protein
MTPSGKSRELVLEALAEDEAPQYPEQTDNAPHSVATFFPSW